MEEREWKQGDSPILPPIDDEPRTIEGKMRWLKAQQGSPKDLFEPINMLNDFNPGATDSRRIPGPGYESTAGAELAETQYRMLPHLPPLSEPELTAANAPERDMVFVVLTLERTMDLVGRFITHVETAPTTDVCKCEWIIHPADVDKPVGNRRMRRGDASLECPVHSREGMILGFLQYAMKETA